MSDVLSGQELFGRVVAVEVGQAGQETSAWTDLRVNFSVLSTKERTPNKAKVQIYGLSRDSSAICREKRAVLQLLAGYSVPERLFLGGIDRSWREQQGVDAITNIEASDGGRQFRTATIAKSFSGEVSAQRVLDELATALGVPLGFVDDEVPDVRITSGLTLAGKVSDHLDRLAGMLGREWFIQDETLVFLRPDKVSAELSFVVASDSGLVGSPAPSTDKKARGAIEVTMLLQPKVRPGVRFELKSREYTGVYKVESVQHEGDNWSKNWYTKVVARESK